MGKTRVQAAYDRVAGEYDNYYRGKREQAEDRFVVRRARKAGVFKLGGVLDVACGTGLLLDLEKIPPAEYLGSDISHEMLARARRKHPQHTFSASDMRVEIVKPESVGGVVCLYCGISYLLSELALEHALSTFYKALKPGGAFFLVFYGHATREARAYDVAVPRRYVVPKEVLVDARRVLRDAKLRAWAFSSARYHRLPSWLPRWFFFAWLVVESWFLGRWWAESARFVVLEGVKPCRG